MTMLALAACGGVAPHPDATAMLPARLSAAFATHDAIATSELFALDATAELIGDPQLARGRAAIARDLASLFHRVPDATLAIGRVFRAPHTLVVEVVLRGTCTAGPLLGMVVPARPIGVAGAVVIVLDDAGAAHALRLYVDVATALGQIAPGLLPAGSEVRPLEPPPATGTFVARGGPDEARDLALAGTVLDALDAHDAAAALASAAPDYRYVDYAAPVVLDNAGTQAMVAGFLGVVADFAIVAKPVLFAADGYVVTEQVEHARLRDQPLVLHAVDIKRIAGGRVHAEWQYSNYIEILVQVRGMTPPALR